MGFLKDEFIVAGITDTLMARVFTSLLEHSKATVNTERDGSIGKRSPWMEHDGRGQGGHRGGVCRKFAKGHEKKSYLTQTAGTQLYSNTQAGVLGWQKNMAPTQLSTLRRSTALEPWYFI